MKASNVFDTKISAPCTKPDIKDGTVTPDTATISSGSSYEVTCNEAEGYVISGTSKISCSNGVLSELPTCGMLAMLILLLNLFSNIIISLERCIIRLSNGKYVLRLRHY